MGDGAGDVAVPNPPPLPVVCALPPFVVDDLELVPDLEDFEVLLLELFLSVPALSLEVEESEFDCESFPFCAFLVVDCLFDDCSMLETSATVPKIITPISTAVIASSVSLPAEVRHSLRASDIFIFCFLLS